ncbi:MAG: NAD(P)H-hydrate epimerase [Proteobacteria bacterium]|nr:NAD(P)H-hydrate epimerase [Pseudomonadota bacterium]
MQGYEFELERAFGGPVFLTASELRTVDEKASKVLGLPGLVLMENAGLHATEVALTMLPNDNPSAVILCGAGNNGGDGYVIARQLHLLGIQVKVLWSVVPSNLKGDALVNARVAENLGIRMESLFDPRPWSDCGLVVDALLGTGLQGPLREPLAGAMQEVNRTCEQNALSTLAIDIPSGMNADSGQAADQTIRAHQTVTFAARKKGFQEPSTSHFTGQVQVVSIGIPAIFLFETLRIT